MYICPFCEREFESETIVAKHYLNCWRELHPYHLSKDAPRSENIEVRETTDDVVNFLNSLGVK